MLTNPFADDAFWKITLTITLLVNAKIIKNYAIYAKRIRIL